MTIALSLEQLVSEAQNSSYLLKLIRWPLLRPYRDEYKSDLSPFNSKDVITLIMNRFDRLFDTGSLKNNGVLLQIFPLHDNNDLNFIRKHKKFGKSYFQSLWDMVCENSEKQQFTGLVAIKNYFGEKYALIYAFFQFIAAWLAVPALFSIFVTAH